MENSIQEYLEKMRQLPAEKASELLMSDFSLSNPNTGEVFRILPRRSWPKTEQKKLANYFLQNIPHSYDKGYSAILKIMSLKTFIEILKQHVPNSFEDRLLLKYYVEPIILNHPCNIKYQFEVAEFLSSLVE